MIEASTERLDRSVRKFRETIEELEAIDGSYTEESAESVVPRMVFRKEDLSFLFAELPNEKTADVRREYESLLERSASIIDNQEYQEQAQISLWNRLNTLPQLICDFAELEPYTNEINHVLSRRDTIEAVVRNLEEHADIEEAKVQLEAFDRVFLCRYQRHLDRVKNHAIEIDYYPDSFWWRHPSTIDRDTDLDSLV